MINYFYNIKLKEEKIDFYSDVLTNIRKDYYLSKLKQKGKINQNSDSDYVNYEFSLEKDKPLKWCVSDRNSIISEVKYKGEGRYSVEYYEDNGSSKNLIFSKYHTLLKVEYCDNKISNTPRCTLEPRKNNNDLCLLMSKKSSYASTILFPMPDVDDEYILDKIESDFEDYTAVASTNIGVVKFLSAEQLELFESFVAKSEEMKKADTAPMSFIDEKDAELASILNPKDFNIKKNLSTAIDISAAEEFVVSVDEIVSEVVGEEFTVEHTDEPDFIDFASQSMTSVVSEPIDETPDVEFEESLETQDVSTDVFEELVFETEDVPSKVEDEYDTSQIFVEEAYEPSGMQAEIDRIFEEETPEQSEIDELIAIADTKVQQIDDSFDEEQVEENSFITESEPVTLSSDSEEIVATNEIEDVVNIVENIDDTTETEVFDVEQQEIPDCIIDSASTRYLYFGELDNEGKRAGYGRTSSENGRTAYEGYYRDNKRDGVGAYYYKDGQLCYYGDWKNNKRDGFGIGISSFDKSAHVGMFVDNKPMGDGVRVDSTGEISFVKKVLSDSTSITIRFENDKLIITKYNENGDIISENTSNLMYF